MIDDAFVGINYDRGAGIGTQRSLNLLLRSLYYILEHNLFVNLHGGMGWGWGD